MLYNIVINRKGVKYGIELVHFSIGKPKQMKYGEDKEMITGICKDPTEEAFLSKTDFVVMT